ncbi:hypothetical protein ACQY0O_001113 [Thecaphora frezii]
MRLGLNVCLALLCVSLCLASPTCVDAARCTVASAGATADAASKAQRSLDPLAHGAQPLAKRTIPEILEAFSENELFAQSHMPEIFLNMITTSRNHHASLEQIAALQRVIRSPPSHADFSADQMNRIRAAERNINQQATRNDRLNPETTMRRLAQHRPRTSTTRFSTTR